MTGQNPAAQDLRGIAANTARDLALGLRLALLRMEGFEPGQGKDAARDLAEQLSASARRAVELYYLESLTQAVSLSEGGVPPRRREDLKLWSRDGALDIGQLKSGVPGCYNKVGFALLLECEVERARRRKVPLSVALFRIDPPASALVQEVARHGRECCRLLDVIATFGDRGVGILMPDTGREGAQVAAQRVISSYLAVRGLNPDSPRAERLDVGVSTCPDDGSDPRELLSRAEERAGGNLLVAVRAG